MSLTADFIGLCEAHGSVAIIHRDDSTTPCPCRTPEGYRDPIWHLQNPSEEECNEAGMLSGGTPDVSVKGFVQPVQSGAVRRLVTEDILAMFGEIQTDDHIALLPCTWGSGDLFFEDWGQAGEDWVEYNGRRYQVVSVNLIPDPSDGNPRHHYELGLRLISEP